MQVTSRAIYVNILTELMKEESPSLYMEDYLYYINRAVSDYIKARYELYETTQQLSDDLRFWKKTFTSKELLVPINSIHVKDGTKTKHDYRHLLSCVIEVDIKRPMLKCPQKVGEKHMYKATRISSDTKAGLLDNAYLQSTFYRPYFDVIDNSIYIRAGKEDKNVVITNVIIEYLCNPAIIDLTEEQVEEDDDTSDMLEFSSDVAEEIVKVAMKLILERGTPNRLQSHIAVNQAISDVSSGMRGGK
jgi:hypothetical protein